MNQEQLAIVMADIVKRQKIKENSLAELVKLHDESNAHLPSDKILQAVHVEDLYKEEKRIESIKRKADSATADLQKAENSFLSSLPKSIQKLMKDEGYVLTASWVTQDAQQLKYGPFAAYFFTGQLVIEPYSSLSELKAEMIIIRKNEAALIKAAKK